MVQFIIVALQPQKNKYFLLTFYFFLIILTYGVLYHPIYIMNRAPAVPDTRYSAGGRAETKM